MGTKFRTISLDSMIIDKHIGKNGQKDEKMPKTN